MRLVHLADLHLGYRQYHRLTPKGLNQREADIAGAFQRAIDRVIALKPDIVLFAGDVFHSVRPNNSSIIHAFSQLSRLRIEVPESIVVMVSGDHDRPRSTETGCILRLFSQLGIHVADVEPRCLVFPEKNLSILGVPHVIGALPALTPNAEARFNVLLLHGEVEGVLPSYMTRIDRASPAITYEELGASRWSYVALGHWHVHRKVLPNGYYSGALDYTTPNVWGEIQEEREAGISGKGFIEYDLETSRHRFHAIEPSRRMMDLPPIHARGLSAPEVDAEIRSRVEGCDGGIDDKIIRLVIRDVPRHVVRDLDHKKIREYKSRALNFRLDTRRPELMRDSTGTAPGKRPTLRETVESYLSRRPLESDIERDDLVRLGLRYLDEADAAGMTAAAPMGGE